MVSAPAALAESLPAETSLLGVGAVVDTLGEIRASVLESRALCFSQGHVTTHLARLPIPVSLFALQELQTN